MGAREETVHELDGETIAGSPLSVRKMQTFEHVGSLAAVAQTFAPRRTRSRLFMSIYIVIIQAKINVLLPFGPLAVMLRYLTGKHVRIVNLCMMVYIFLGSLFLKECVLLPL